MIVFESHRIRRLLVRIDRAKSLHDELERLAREKGVTTAWVQGVGVLGTVEVDSYDLATGRRREPRRLAGPFEALSISGSIASFDGQLRAELHATLVRESDRGLETVGGHLALAEVIAVDLMIDSLDDLGVRRELDRETGLLRFRAEGRQNLVGEGTPPRSSQDSELRRPEVRPPERAGRVVEAPSRPEPVRPEPAPRAEPVAGGGVTWAMAAAASEHRPGTPSPASKAPVVHDPIREEKRVDDEPEFLPAPGDWVDHRQFGMCRVDRASEDGELLIKLETGRRKAIRLDFLDVLPPRMEGNRRIYPLRPKKR